MVLRLPSPCVIVLVGPSAAGKSTWCERNFRADQVLSTDRFRALVGHGEQDQSASADAFAVLDQILALRLRRRLTTVIDSTGLDARSRRRWVDAASTAGVAVVAVCFGGAPAELRRRNRARTRRVPEEVLRAQIRASDQTRPLLAGEGFAVVSEPDDVRLVPASIWWAGQAGREVTDGAGTDGSRGLDGLAGSGVPETTALNTTLHFGLHVSRFDGPGGAATLRDRLAMIAGAAERAGFRSLWVMDHLRQIPQVGPAWEDLLECFTTLGYLAGLTRTIRLGTLVSPITFRQPALLGKTVASLDVLSGGRAICGLGAGWFAAEHRAYGVDFPRAGERLDLLEDVLQLLPLLWGPGSPGFSGKVLQVPEAACYPRPLQAKMPILVGGSGERRTLGLVARYADAANLMGDATHVAAKRAVLARHCEAVGRPLLDIELTHLSTVLSGMDDAQLDELVAARRPRRANAERFAASVGAGTVDEQIARFRRLAAVGVDTAIVRLADLDDVDAVRRFTPVIEALSREP